MIIYPRCTEGCGGFTRNALCLEFLFKHRGTLRELRTEVHRGLLRIYLKRFVLVKIFMFVLNTIFGSTANTASCESSRV